MAELFSFREAADAAWGRPEQPHLDLTWSELMLAGMAGVMRRVSAMAAGRQEIFYNDQPWTGEVNGAIGEMSLARYYNVYWSGTVGRVDLPDVGPYQVRTKMQPHHSLIVRPGDSDEEAFVSVLIEIPRCTFCGWLYGWEAKQERWWKAPKGLPPAFFVPDSALRPIEELARP